MSQYTDLPLSFFVPFSFSDVESLIALLEQSKARSVTFAVRTGATLYSTLHRIYRASAYGAPSLLFRGIRSPLEFRKALRVCHQCYCELSEEGVEFNGFFPRGAMIDTPLALSASEPYYGCDFLCPDYDRLCRLCGNAETAVREQLTFLFESNPTAERRLLITHPPERELIDFCHSVNIREVYLPKHLFFPRGEKEKNKS